VRAPLVTAIAAAVLLGCSAVAAQEIGAITYRCRSPSAPETWVFSLDYGERTVVVDAPVNWAWFTRQHVLFLHSVFVNDRQYVTQSYTLDLATGAFEVCDFAAGEGRTSPCDSTFLCRSDGSWR
jgi:hypothetical protein